MMLAGGGEGRKEINQDPFLTQFIPPGASYGHGVQVISHASETGENAHPLILLAQPNSTARRELPRGC